VRDRAEGFLNQLKATTLPYPRPVHLRRLDLPKIVLLGDSVGCEGSQCGAH